MGDGTGDRVGGIVRLRDLLQFQQEFDHLLDLLFVGPAVAGESLLDLHGGIFVKALGILRGGDDRRPAGGTDHEGGGDVVGEEQLFKRDLIRMVKGDHIPDTELQRAQAVLHGDAGLGLNTAVVDQTHAAAFRLHHTPAHEGVARVDAQNDQKNRLFPI